jgi:membrane-associated phospholipid phosphatase
MPNPLPAATTSERIRGPLFLLALAGLWLAMLLLGAGTIDRDILLRLYAGDQAWLALVALGFTFLGNWSTVIVVTVLAVGWMLYRGLRRRALILLVASLTGRGLVILEKAYFARLRPDENLHLAEVHYQSFPSGHSANSMIVYLGIALLAVEKPEHRRVAICAALLLTFLIGFSRPILGVHWPSDVIAGWSFGALWLLLVMAVADRFVPGNKSEKLTVKR